MSFGQVYLKKIVLYLGADGDRPLGKQWMFIVSNGGICAADLTFSSVMPLLDFVAAVRILLIKPGRVQDRLGQALFQKIGSHGSGAVEAKIFAL